MQRLKNGEGTIGKLLTSDKIYGDVETMFVNFRDFSANLKDFSAKFNTGTGTVGKLLTDDTIYNEMEAFVKDIRAHPWKLLSRS
jgi:phospholipid/cholesterol/gamma-HCH transport system substrate-binding protein